MFTAGAANTALEQAATAKPADAVSIVRLLIIDHFPYGCDRRVPVLEVYSLKRKPARKVRPSVS